ncbi:MAG: hypothetical protein M3O70_06695 [Actinomycetota bacterium]|nr:hypothetical protein [Actinomycetota bacterium]
MADEVEKRDGVWFGPETSDTVERAKAINSPDEHEDYEGQTLVTTNHEVIKRWAEERGGVPSTVPGTEHGDHLGVLRFQFPGFGSDDLTEVTWEEFFDTFDQRQLNFIFQEHTSDGNESNFSRFESPHRETG